MADAHANFAYSTVATAPSPASSGTTLNVQAGEGANFPAAPFNCTVWPATGLPLNSTAEVIRVTSKGSGDDWTIQRAQEGSSAKSIAIGYRIAATITAKTLTDAELSITDGANSVGAGTLRVSNSNGISAGLNGSTLTFSHNGLTTARASTDAIGLNTAQSNVTWTINSSGLSLDARGYAGVGTSATNASITLNSNGLAISVAAPGGGGNFSAGVSNVGNTGGDTGISGTRLVLVGSQNITLNQATDANGLTVSFSGGAGAAGNTGFLSAGGDTASLGTVVFSNSNGVSFGVNGQTVTASHNGLTQQSTQSAIRAFGVSNTGQTAGNTGVSTGIDWVLAGSQSITLSQSTAGGGPNTVWLQHPAWLTTAMLSNAVTLSNIRVSAGTTSNLLSAVTFANGNGISFGLDASTLTASYTVPTVTNSSMSVSDSGTSGTLARLAFTNLNGVTLSLSTGAGGSHTIVGSHNALTSQSNQNVTAANGGFAFQTLSFSNVNGISFGTSAGSALTASHNALTTARASTDAVGLATAQTNVTWTVNSAGLSFNAAGYAGTGTTFAGANISASFTFNSVGLNMSASVAPPGAAAEANAINLLGANTAGNTTATGSTIGWSGVNLTLSGTNASQVVVSAPATSSLSATGIVSISVNGSTISIGAGRTISGMVFAPLAGVGGPLHFAQSSASMGQNSLYFFPIQAHDYLSFDNIRIPVFITNSSSGAASVQKGQTIQVGIYTRHSTNATVYSRHYSTSYTIAASHNSNASWMLSLITAIGNSTSYSSLTASSAGLNLSASLHGYRELIVPVSTLLPPGDYWIAYLASTSSAGAAGNVLNMSNLAVAYATANRIGVSTNTSNGAWFREMGLGLYSATTSALPGGISQTQLNLMGTQPVLRAGMGTV